MLKKMNEFSKSIEFLFMFSTVGTVQCTSVVNLPTKFQLPPKSRSLSLECFCGLFTM